LLPITFCQHNYLNFCDAATASRSTRLFRLLSECPFTLIHLTSCGCMAVSISSHKSRFSTGFLLDFFHPRFIHPLIQFCWKVLMISALSLWICTRQGSVRTFRASITARISIRLLVVSWAPPVISRSLPFHCSSAAQPPGPGFPLQAPSVNTITVFLSDILLGNRC